MGKFITIDTESFANSIYVPQSNGKISSATNSNGENGSCWYVDSRNGRWSTLACTVENVTQGEDIELVFWAKYSATPTAFQMEIMQSDYEKRSTYKITSSSEYYVGKKGVFRLFRISHTASENVPATIALSVNDCEMYLFPATAEDIELFSGKPHQKGLISRVHPVCSLMNGENYSFCACMSYLAECLGMDKSVYDFHYYAMATGDIFTQIHIDNLSDCTDCVSDYLFDNSIVYRAFCATGFTYDFYDKKMIEADNEAVFNKIKESIDLDIPVISAGLEDCYDFCIICGYTDDGMLKIMFKENEEPILQKNLLAFTRGLIFTGEYRHDINLKQQFSNITRSIYDCVSRKAERGCTFGKEAFTSWADSLTNGATANADIVDAWCSFGYNLCMMGTNGYAGSPMLKDILAKCPEFEQTKAYPILKNVCAQFDVQNEFFGGLMGMGFGFDIPEEKLRNPDYMRPAAEKIKQLCGVYDKILEAYPEKVLSDDDFWCADDYRIVNCYKQQLPPMRFVGLTYKNSDRVDGMFSEYWEEWHAASRFETLEALITDEFKEAYSDWGAYVGLMKNKNGADDDYFEYRIGMFLPADCEVPEGFDSVDINHECAGICWIKGHEWDVYCHEGECYNTLVKNGMTIPSEEDGGCYMFERYGCPRFTTPDEYNEVILDLGFFTEKENPVKDLSELKASDGTDKLEYFNLPDARVIGKSMRCPLDMSQANPIPAFWGKCAEEGLFDVCGALPKLIPAMLGFTDDYDPKTKTFLYITGVLCPKDTPVPQGYTYRDIPSTVVSKSCYGDWMDKCEPTWANDGYIWNGDKGQCWNSELYLDGEDNNGFRLLCAVKKI